VPTAPTTRLFDVSSVPNVIREHFTEIVSLNQGVDLPSGNGRAHAKLRSPGERANAQLKTWRILRKLRCCPWRAGQLAKAIHVLQVREA
jgi:hypothetical protein